MEIGSEKRLRALVWSMGRKLRSYFGVFWVAYGASSVGG